MTDAKKVKESKFICGFKDMQDYIQENLLIALTANGKGEFYQNCWLECIAYFISLLEFNDIVKLTNFFLNEFVKTKEECYIDCVKFVLAEMSQKKELAEIK